MPDREQTVLMHRFIHRLLQDVEVLDRMLAEGHFKADVRRIGVEQELFLIDGDGHAASCAPAVLARSTDPSLVAEIGRFNLEINLAPLPFAGDSLSRVETRLGERLGYARRLAREAGADVVLFGILPTVRRSDLMLEHMMPHPRYHRLFEQEEALRTDTATIRIDGQDELYMRHDVAILEAATASFQVHLQVVPGEFARYYNAAQVAAAPVLAAAANAPLLFGRRLWHETRIAAFQHAVDTRAGTPNLREVAPRVRFGGDWLRGPVTDLFKEDIARFRVTLPADHLEDAEAALEAGRPPKLEALQLHNSTVYRWNRACYGITDGKPHLRIENRILPAGPSVVDEVANAALWLGLVNGLARHHPDVDRQLDFDDVKRNFLAAARLGLDAELVWLGGASYPAGSLLRGALIPLAGEGLRAAGIDEADRRRYLDLIEARVTSGRNGARWQLDAFDHDKATLRRSVRLSRLVKAAQEHQEKGTPVHAWPMPEGPVPKPNLEPHRFRVEQYMATDLFTVHEGESVELVASLMEWQALRHVLVEDDRHRLVGLIDRRTLLRYLVEQGLDGTSEDAMPVREAMIRNLVTAAPETSVPEAMRLMRQHCIGSLPVVQDGRLVGLVSERSLLALADQVIEEVVGSEG